MFVHWALDKRTPVQARENGAKAELLSFTKTSFILFWTFTVETCKLILLAVVNFIRYGLLNKINFGRAPPGAGRPPGGAPRRPAPLRVVGAAGPAPHTGAARRRDTPHTGAARTARTPALPTHRGCPHTEPARTPALPARRHCPPPGHPARRHCPHTGAPRRRDTPHRDSAPQLPGPAGGGTAAGAAGSRAARKCPRRCGASCGAEACKGVRAVIKHRHGHRSSGCHAGFFLSVQIRRLSLWRCNKTSRVFTLFNI